MSCDQSWLLSQLGTILLDNIKRGALQEMQGAQQQSLSEEWFHEKWLPVTASKCHPALKVEKLIVE